MLEGFNNYFNVPNLGERFMEDRKVVSTTSSSSDRKAGLERSYNIMRGDRIVRNIDGVNVVILENVYDPSHDSYLISSVVKYHGKVVDLGSGSGYLTAKLVMAGNEVIAIDISPYAVMSTKETLISNNVYNEYVHIIQGDGLKPLRRDKFIDAIYVNPPYLPVYEFHNWLSRSWSGGSEGIQVFLNMIEGINELLKESGVIYFTLSTCSNIDRAVEWLSNVGFKAVEICEICFFMECIKLFHASKT